MSRDAASSMIAWVDGPNARRSASLIKRSSSARKSKSFVRLDQVVDQANGELPGLDADGLLPVAVDHVVAAGLTGAPRLAPRDVRAGLPLELERHVLGDVAEPGPVDEAFPETAATTE